MSEAISEKRGLSRLPCHLEAYLGKDRAGFINNISLSGFQISTPHKVNPNKQYSFNVRFPDEKKFYSYHGKIVYSLYKTEEGQFRNGFQILSTPRSAKRILEKFILKRRLATQTEELLQSFKSQHGQGLEPIQDQKQIERIFQEIPQKISSFRLVFNDIHESIEAKFVRLENSLLCFRPTGKTPPLQNGSTCLSISMIDYQSYYFETTLLAVESNGLFLRVPQKIFYSEKRDRLRRQPGEGDWVRVEPPIADMEPLVYPLLDYSETGLSLLNKQSNTVLFPGTPLPRIVWSRKPEEPLSAVVRHVTPLKSAGEKAYKIGLQLETPRVLTGHASNGAVQRDLPTRKKPFAAISQKIAGALGLIWEAQKEKLRKSPNDQVNVVRYSNSMGQEIVGILDSTLTLGRGQKSPAIIILPAWAKRKEMFLPLALTLTENFRRHYKDATVLRFDLTNHVGESYKDEECREPGKESLHVRPSRILDDIHSSIRFLKKNPYFVVTDIIMISFSFASPFARRVLLEDAGKSVKYWISAMGTSDVQSIMRTVGGGIDYVGNYRNGIRSGVISFFGVLADSDIFCDEALNLHLASVEDAKREMSELTIPVTSILGKYDAWVDAEKVKTIMAVPAPAERELVELPTGHLLTTSDEAFGTFELISRKISEHLYGETLVTSPPNFGRVARRMEKERNRLAREKVTNTEGYWQNYLLGNNDNTLGYDVLSYSPDYQGFLRDELALLDVRGGDNFVDLGAGTGLFGELLLRDTAPDRRPRTMAFVDIVDEALERARQKIAPLTNGIQADFHQIDLSPSRLLSVWRFLRGEVYGPSQLTNQIEGISGETIEDWTAHYGHWMHQYLRGETIPDEERQRLAANLQEESWKAAVDFNRAARLISNRLGFEDIQWKALRTDLIHERRLGAGDLLGMFHAFHKGLSHNIAVVKGSPPELEDLRRFMTDNENIIPVHQGGVDPNLVLQALRRNADSLAALAHDYLLLILLHRAASYIPANHIIFQQLYFGGTIIHDRIPLDSDQYDKALCSLLLPYLFNPGETVREIFRILKPGGTVVASTMKPDADFSMIYKRILSVFEKDSSLSAEQREKLFQSARTFMNAAAELWYRQDEGQFVFFSEESFSELFRQAGFQEIHISRSYGSPPQGIILTSRKP